ncbi:hypothetical protein AMIS_19570 [Actinoplanes missouriensis 431]|uniref:Uncharacterized protein n=1 Tax=Actinoplanes missouriensis (strain ATCC 14538 / DSM 43046 / CBS 188.64 / JCM 3121 / NBRC 102363 / NCIMB 12654 / NRRL B-3342 / UNCC 431) TaxID=512565 RepID=I0H2E0_ACTM4|nr:hypothetical protein [Actinoplanes missouriensis]BAL87177.1 hypothetical protein AMIS_19570 [Actinoplanes missouriensis 431]
MNARTWHMGDNEPEDLPRIVDAYGDTWWVSASDRSEKNRNGWRSAHLAFSEPSKTWWWLSMYRGPLTEETP